MWAIPWDTMPESMPAPKPKGQGLPAGPKSADNLLQLRPAAGCNLAKWHPFAVVGNGVRLRCLQEKELKGGWG